MIAMGEAPRTAVADLHSRFWRSPLGLLFQEDSDVGHSRVVSPYAFGRLGFDAHTIGRDLQQSRDMFANLDSMRPDLRRVENQGGIEIDDVVAGSLDPFQRFPQENHRISSLPLRIRRRE